MAHTATTQVPFIGYQLLYVARQNENNDDKSGRQVSAIGSALFGIFIVINNDNLHDAWPHTDRRTVGRTVTDTKSPAEPPPTGLLWMIGRPAGADRPPTQP